MMLSYKDPDEVITLTFDFSALTPSVSSPVISISVLSGIDATPNSIVSGSAQIAGGKILQAIAGGIDGVVYKLKCQIDAPGGSRYVLAANLPVKTAT